MCQLQCVNVTLSPGGLVTYTSLNMFCQPSHLLIFVTVPKSNVARYGPVVFDSKNV
jgi:hypothetical protein